MYYGYVWQRKNCDRRESLQNCLVPYISAEGEINRRLSCQVRVENWLFVHHLHKKVTWLSSKAQFKGTALKIANEPMDNKVIKLTLDQQLNLFTELRHCQSSQVMRINNTSTIRYCLDVKIYNIYCQIFIFCI